MKFSLRVLIASHSCWMVGLSLPKACLQLTSSVITSYTIVIITPAALSGIFYLRTVHFVFSKQLLHTQHSQHHLSAYIPEMLIIQWQSSIIMYLSLCKHAWESQYIQYIQYTSTIIQKYSLMNCKNRICPCFSKWDTKSLKKKTEQMEQMNIVFEEK